MLHDLPIKILSYDALRHIADNFLRRTHPSNDIPIPIEDIVELKLRIDIVPMPGLQRGCDIEAFITSDMTAIYVDNYVYEAVPNRYRFSLAHEIAHAVLHQKVFRQLAFDNIEDRRRALENISEEDHRWLEWQARAFAGLVLVPSGPLKERFNVAVELASRQGVSIPLGSDPARRIIAGNLAQQFAVSTEVTKIRIDKDELWPT